VISCIPTYYTTPGLLTISVAPGASPGFISFLPITAATVEDRPTIWRIMEDNLQYYTTFDPTDEFRMNDFSRVIYTYGLLHNASTAFASETLASSMSEVFTSFYAAFVSTSIIALAPKAQVVSGTSSGMQNRLFVFEPIAFVIMGVVGLAFLCNIAVAVYAQRTTSVQNEDSDGILGNAMMLDGSSDVESFIEKLKVERVDGETRLMDVAKGNNELEKARCWWEGGRVMLKIDEVDMMKPRKPTCYICVGHGLASLLRCLVSTFCGGSK